MCCSAMVLVRTSEPPTLLQHADTLRYLLLAVSGGIYSDIDTKRLKPISEWSRHAELWKDGKGWLSADDRKRMDAEGGLPPPSVIIGIEADVGDRSDWHDWWPRPLQIVQWTLASAPHHPIFIRRADDDTATNGARFVLDVRKTVGNSETACGGECRSCEEVE